MDLLLDDAVADLEVRVTGFKVSLVRDVVIRSERLKTSPPLEVVLEPARRGDICGYMTMPDGSPAQGVRVVLFAKLLLRQPIAFQRDSRFGNMIFASETTTDENGWYCIKGTYEGEYAVLLSASVRARSVYGVVISYEAPPEQLREYMPIFVEDVVIGVEPKLRRDFRFERGGWIRGVLQEKGTNKGLAGQRIAVYPFQELSNFYGLGGSTPWVYVTSDVQGRFEIPALLQGPYLLKVEDPVTLETSTAIGYALAAAHAKEVRVVYEPPRVRSLEGRVLTANGAPVAEVHVYLPGSGFVARTAGDGTFRLPYVAFRKLSKDEFVYINVNNRDGSSYTMRSKCSDSVFKLGFTLPDNSKSFEFEVKLPEAGVLKRDFIAPK